LVGLAVSLLGIPWSLKCLALFATAAHAVVRRPPPAPRVILQDGIAELPDAGLVDLTVGPGSRYTWWWIHLRLRSADRRVDVVLLVDQLDEETWRALQAELRRRRPRARDASPSPSRTGDG
jgi:hypothetical protein